MKGFFSELFKSRRGVGEYQGGDHAIFAFLGLYIRFFIFKIFGQKKTIKYLSGEEKFPKISKKQRFFCIIVGLFFFVLILLLLIFIVYYINS